MVRQIQKALHLLADGIFGSQTEEAVKNFQMMNGLKADGIVGPATLAKLIQQRLKKSRRNITKIIVHCSATPEGEDKTVADIRADHKKQGWSDIGYHYVIYRDGTVHNGRDVDIQGAHCGDNGGNIGSIGVCYIGGVERRIPGVAYKNLKPKDTRTDAQKVALLNLLLDLKKLYPHAVILGHRDLDEHGKLCPSFDAKKEYSKI
jgi:N-acetylmuramoyl-L-alanine amidase